jgi:hypothetical protein
MFKLNTFEKEGPMYIVVCYLCYLAISLSVTVWVAKTLRKNGRVFLMDAFRGNAELVDSVNSLLVVGFYLINIGWVALALRTSAALDATRELIELLSYKIGIVLMVLGVMHFFNLLVFSRMRKRGQERERPPRPPMPPPAPGWAPGGISVGKVLD